MTDPIKLQLTADSDGTLSLPAVVLVPPPQPAAPTAPTIDFTFTQLKGLVGQVVNHSILPNGGSCQIAWGPPKAWTAIGPRGTASFAYPAVGSYSVSASYKAADGKVYSTTEQVAIVDAPTPPANPTPPTTTPPPTSAPPPVNPPPAPPPGTSANGAVAGLTAKLLADGVTVVVTDTTVKGKQTLWAATIDFGDPDDPENVVMIRQNRAIPHVYRKPGTYTIRLTSADMSNVQCSASTTIEVTGTLPAFSQPPAQATDAVVTGMVAGGETFALATAPGAINRIFADARGGSVKHYADGAVALDNMFASCTNDLFLYVVVSQGGNELYRGNLPLWAHAGARPFWYVDRTVKPDADLSLAPIYDLTTGGKTASVYDAYMASDNSPVGYGLSRLDMGGEGEDLGMGPTLPGWDAPQFTNPNAQNAAVAFGMSDAARPIPYWVRDDKTGEMLRVSDYPKASMLAAFLGKPGNPIQAYDTACVFNLEQAQAHAPVFSAAACMLGGFEADKESLAMWANYVQSLINNPGYRIAAGCTGAHDAQTRGKGRGLAVTLYAAKLSTYPEYFDAWVKAILADYEATFTTQVGIQIDQALHAGYPHNDYAPWQGHLLTYGVGRSLDLGYAAAQKTFDYFAATVLDSMLAAQHELATIYNNAQCEDDGKTMLPNWVAGLKQEATYNARLAAALPCAEGSQELLDAMKKGTPDYGQYQPGDFMGYPWNAVGYPAVLGLAMAQIARHATDQVRAQAAYAKFRKYARFPFGKYSIVDQRAA